MGDALFSVLQTYAFLIMKNAPSQPYYLGSQV